MAGKRLAAGGRLAGGRHLWLIERLEARVLPPATARSRRLPPTVAMGAPMHWAAAILSELERIAPDAAALVLMQPGLGLLQPAPRAADATAAPRRYPHGAATATPAAEARPPADRRDHLAERARVVSALRLLDSCPSADGRDGCTLALLARCGGGAAADGGAVADGGAAVDGGLHRGVAAGRIGAVRLLHSKVTSIYTLAADLCAGGSARDEHLLLTAAHALAMLHPGQVYLGSAAHAAGGTAHVAGVGHAGGVGPAARLLSWPPYKASDATTSSLLPVGGRFKVAKRLCSMGLAGSPPSPTHARLHRWSEAEQHAQHMATAACKPDAI